MNTPLPEILLPHWYNVKVIVVMKGLPSTGKSEIATLIGQWARANVLYIDDFLETLSLENGYTSEAMPSTEEADRILRLALVGLYKAAAHHLRDRSNRVVIKSRFNSTFELDLWMKLMCDHTDFHSIIIESQMKNEYRWRSKFDSNASWCGKKWYNARSWDDIQQAKQDNDSQSLDFHLLSSFDEIQKAHQDADFVYPAVRRLVFDYFDDAVSIVKKVSFEFGELTRDFKDAIIYMLLWYNDISYKARFVAQLQFNELSRYLLEQEIRESRERRKYLCNSSNSRAGSCLFKFWGELPVEDVDDDHVAINCNACEEEVGPGQPGYTCHFCFLTLHKTCADTMPDFEFLNDVRAHRYDYCFRVSRLHPSFFRCKSCTEVGSHYAFDECESCCYENHLRNGLLPTIINHDCHDPHFLSIHFAVKNPIQCKACAEVRDNGKFHPVYYACHLCKLVYHLDCAFLPGQVKQEHGGHEHAMKLMYSHDRMDQEDDHWCNACYKEMDPQDWFYSCQDCPYYLTHITKTCVEGERISEAVTKGDDIPIQRTHQRKREKLHSLSYLDLLFDLPNLLTRILGSQLSCGLICRALASEISPEICTGYLFAPQVLFELESVNSGLVENFVEQADFMCGQSMGAM